MSAVQRVSRGFHRLGLLLAAVPLLVGALIVVPSFGAAPPKFPVLTGRVIDEAKLLSEDDERELIAKLKALEDESSNRLVVVTLPSLQGYSIEDCGCQLGRYWGSLPGTAKLTNDVLLIVAPNEGKVRIEVGAGLEKILTVSVGLVVRNLTISAKF